MRYFTAHFIMIMLMASGCQNKKEALPYLGKTDIKDGKEIHHKVGEFSCYNQDSVLISTAGMSEYIYVADFFFTSCPSICPKVMKEMTKIYETYKNEPSFKLVSFSIDPKRDNISRLKLYADNLGVDQKKWFFLTGEKDKMLDLANTYFVAAFEDSEAPGGFDHSGKIILVDKEGHVRSFSEGTDQETTSKIIADIATLLDSYKNKQ